MLFKTSAIIDQLTDVHNRRFFEEGMLAELSNVQDAAVNLGEISYHGSCDIRQKLQLIDPSFNPLAFF